MRLLTIILALVLMPFLAISQQLYGTGISYTNGVPTYTPQVSQKAAELCFSISKKMLYKWNRSLSRWEPVAGITEQYGVPVVAPSIGETNTKIDNTTGRLYWWTGSTWLDLVAAADQVRGELTDSLVVVRAYADSLFANIVVDSLVKSATLSGFLAANSIPYVDNNGRLNARGFEQFAPLGSAPSAPASGFAFYADATGRPSWRGSDGFTRTFDASTLTANRVYTLQDKSYTLADHADVTALQSTVAGLGSTYFPLVGGAITGTGGAGYIGFPAQSSTPIAPATGFRAYANSANNLAFLTPNGYTTTISLADGTGHRFFNLPANAGTFGILENTQTWTGATNTFNSVVGTTFTHSQPSQQNWGATDFNGTVNFRFSRNNTISSSPNNLTYSAFSAHYVNVNGVTSWEVLQRTAALKFGASPGFGMEDGMQVIGRLGVGLTSFFGTNPNVTPNGSISTQSLYVLNGYGDYQAGAAFQVSGTNRFAINAPVMTDAQVSALTGLTAGGWVYSMTQNRPYVHNGTAFQGVVLGPQAGFTAGQIAYGGTGGNLTSSAGVTIGEPIAGYKTIVLNGKTFATTNVNNELQIGNDVTINNVAFTRDVRFTGWVDNTSANLGLRGNSGILMQSLSGGQLMTVTQSGINIDYNTPPVMLTTSAGSLFRTAFESYNDATTASGGTVSASSIISFAGGSVAATNATVTHTNAATLRIFSAPTAGTNVTITNPWAIQVAAGSSYFPRIVFGSNFSNQGGIMASITPTNSAFYGTVATSGNYAAAAFQAQNIGTGIVAGVIGNVTSNASSAGAFYGVIGEAMGQPNLTGGSLVGVLGYFRSGASGVTNNVTGTAFSAKIDLSSTAGSGGLPNSFVGGYVIETVSRNNSGAATLVGFYSAGIGSPSGLANTIANYNPLALNSGTLTNVTNTWSYIDHRLVIGSASNPNAAALLDLVSTTRGLLIPRATNAQIAAVSSPPVGLQMISTGDERIHLKRTDGFYQVAYTQDIKRDTAYRTVNANLDLSGLTTTFANRYKRVVVETIVTAAATGNNTIIMPVPSAALLGTKFEISVEDTSGDGDISVLSFGTDGTDGYLYNGDGTYATSQNLFSGFGVYVSVSWCEAKGAYRWKLQ